MSIGRKLINWNDARAARFAREHGCSPVWTPWFSTVDDLGHWLEIRRTRRWLRMRKQSREDA